MSHFTNLIGPNGPILITLIGVSSARHTALIAANQVPPVPVVANLLIDTGASHTCIDNKFVSLLGLNPTGTVSMHTPSTGTMAQSVDTFDIALGVNGIAGALHFLPDHSVMACDFSSQGIDGLLGRDILGTSRLIYSGPDNTFYLSF